MAAIDKKGLSMFFTRVRPEVEYTVVAEPLSGIAGERLRCQIRKSLQSGAHTHIIDLRSLRTLDSYTLATLIRILRYVRASNGYIGLIVDQEPFLKILSITALNRVFPVFRDKETAMDSLKTIEDIPA